MGHTRFAGDGDRCLDCGLYREQHKVFPYEGPHPFRSRRDGTDFCLDCGVDQKLHSYPYTRVAAPQPGEDVNTRVELTRKHLDEKGFVKLEDAVWLLIICERLTKSFRMLAVVE